MFEFSLQYIEPEYHKPGDPPFQFPPEGVNTFIDANIVEIQGRNGTGKTTLLNILALALGCLEQELALENKPVLKRKLQALYENKSLTYLFRISSSKARDSQGNPFDLVLSRQPNQKPLIQWSSKPIGPEDLRSKIDVIYLTEDDPKKVVNASLGKLARNFKDLYDAIMSLQQATFHHLDSIEDYNTFKQKETKALEEIQISEGKIKKIQDKSSSLQTLLKQVLRKQELKEVLDLLNKQKKITEDYNASKKLYDKIKDKKASSVNRSLRLQQRRLKEYREEIRRIDRQIRTTCKTLGTYGILLESEPLVNHDFTEFNKLYGNISSSKRKERSKKALVDDMIRTLQKYDLNDIVPVLDKPVGTMLLELQRINRELTFDRVSMLFTALNETIHQKVEVSLKRTAAELKIDSYQKSLETIGETRQIRQQYQKNEEQYIALQSALQQDRVQLLSEWGELSHIDESQEEVEQQLSSCKIQLGVDQTILNQRKQRLQIERENAVSEPLFLDKEEQLQTLNDTLIRLSEKLFQWSRILEDPAHAKKQFSAIKDMPGFGLTDYTQFVDSVGQFLGKQFEPLSYAGHSHQIDFFNIEESSFKTPTGRKIKIDDLSQGQSKITTLTGSLKDLDTQKLKILLIDEIADLDPSNIQRVKTILRNKFDEGSLALAVIVRPLHTMSNQMVHISGWN